MIQSSKRNRWCQLRQDSLPTATGELGEVIHVLIPSLAKQLHAGDKQGILTIVILKSSKALPLWVGKEAAWACVGSGA